MTLNELEKESRKRTEDLIGAWAKVPGEKYVPRGQTKRLLSSYQQAFKEIDAQIKEIHLKLLSGIPQADYYNEMVKYGRFESLQKQIATAYSTAAKQAGLAQVEISKTAISNVYYQNMYSVNWFSGLEKKEYFAVLNTKAVEVSVFGTPKVWAGIEKSAREGLLAYQPQHGTLLETLTSNKVKDLSKLRQITTQALIQGKSYTKTAKEIKDLLDITMNNAVRIARTESGRNMNAGSYANTLEAVNAGVELKRRYIAAFGLGTRQQSGSMDGQEVPPDKPFVYPNGKTVSFIVGNSGVAKYDVNDRCTAIDVLEEFPPDQRKAKNPTTGEIEEATYKDFDQWMDAKKLKYNKSGRIVSK
jgi:hypothetical protein